MTDSEMYAQAPVLTPRQDRLEAAVISVLRTGGTRSSLRTSVEEFADYARLRDISPDRALAALGAIALRAMPDGSSRGEPAVGESMPDRLTMMARWLSARYHRAD